MTKKCKQYDFDGKEIDGIEIAYLDKDSRAHMQSINDYIKALRRNARQWSANTKDRSQSNHSGAKPHAQKGTGKARQGFLGAPQYKGGGRVHTPHPKFEQHVRINRKEKRQVIATLLTEKVENDRVYFLKDQVEKECKAPKTSRFAKFLETIEISGSCLFLVNKRDGEEIKNFQKSLKNLPKVSFQYIENLNGYTVIAHQHIVVIESATDNLKELVRG
jgi:large subunit ribosomal protein L4